MVRRTSRLLAAVLLAAAVFLPGATPAAARPDGLLAARNLPAGGKVLFYLGQDSTTLADFAADVLAADPGFPRPAGVTLYTNLVGAPMSGMFQPTDYGAGENDFPATLAEYGGGLAVGLFLSDPAAQSPLKAYAGVADEATTARYRRWLDEFLTYLDRTGRPVFLRIGYEFDGTWNGYEPQLYKDAFRYIAGRIDRLRGDRIATVWQTAAWPHAEQAPYAPTAAGHWDLWYPGDEYVDWAGMSHFYGSGYAAHQWACALDRVAAPPLTVQDSLLAFARSHRKPVFVAEAAPQAYSVGEHTAGCILQDDATGGPHPVAPVGAEGIWDGWYQPFFDYIRANRDIIRGVSYINTHWSAQGMWNCVPGSCPNGYWGDSRVQADPLILQRFRGELRSGLFETGQRGRPRPFAVPDFSEPGRSEGEYADLPQGGTTGIAVADVTASGERTALVYAHGAALEFDGLRPARELTVRYATTTDNVKLTVLVDGVAATTVALPNRGSATAWATVTVPVRVPAGAKVAFRLDGGYVVWIDYITPGQLRPLRW
ncbi:hypothetical protein GCM10009662_56990 [Catellatospora coxensis]|uniref:GH26 domain-containing protein n=1 Tax=Catellatospora coxensis TaxID=310354 RepID=A0A8J3P549_9ACTN|nr:hypothetical protein Cco03nite_07220 [Catellatospora coxensis]